MANLQQFDAKRCATAAGWLLYKGKILLVKHKMLNVWLAPGGHIESNELPHKAAEREFFEETGVKVEAISAQPLFPVGDITENLPMPFVYNLHWINKPGEKKARANGEICEQHYVFGFFVKLSGKLGKLSEGDEGVDGIGWFSKEDLKTLQTSETIRNEALYVFEHYPRLQKATKPQPKS